MRCQRAHAGERGQGDQYQSRKDHKGNLVASGGIVDHAGQPDAQPAAGGVEHGDGAQNLARVARAEGVHDRELQYGVDPAPAQAEGHHGDPDQGDVHTHQDQRADQHDQDVAEKYLAGIEEVACQPEGELAHQGAEEEQADGVGRGARIELRIAHVQEDVGLHAQDGIKGGHRDHCKRPERGAAQCRAKAHPAAGRKPCAGMPRRAGIRSRSGRFGVAGFRQRSGSVVGVAFRRRFGSIGVCFRSNRWRGFAHREPGDQQQDCREQAAPGERAAPVQQFDHRGAVLGKYDAAHARAHERDADRRAPVACEPLGHQDDGGVEPAHHQHQRKSRVDQVQPGEAAETAIGKIAQDEHAPAGEHAAAHAVAIQQNADEGRRKPRKQQRHHVPELDLAPGPAEFVDELDVVDRKARDGLAVADHQRDARENGDEPRVDPVGLRPDHGAVRAILDGGG